MSAADRPPAVPPPPANLTYQVANSTVFLTWNNALGPVTFYRLEAGATPGTTFFTWDSSVLVDPNKLPQLLARFGAGGVPNGVYYVRVRARNRFGLSPPSAELVVTLSGCNSPGAPVGFSAVVQGSTVQFSWSPPVTGDLSRLLGYLISAGFLPGQQSAANLRLGNVTSHTVTGVPAGTYYVRVHALTSCPGSGVGAPSSEVQVVVP